MASKFQSPVIDTDAWARRTAARLRLIHSSFSDQGFEQKKAYLEDEIEFALEDAGALDSIQKRTLLEKLSGCFPVFTDQGESAAPGAPVAEASRNTVKVDPLEQFLAHWTQAGPEQREHISQTLSAAGITPPAASGAALPHEISDRMVLPARAEELSDFSRGIEQLCRELGAPGAQVDINRLVKLLGILAASMRDLHKFIWEFWRQSAPRELQGMMASGFTSTFEATVAAYLRGDEQSSSRELAGEIEKTKRLMLGICFAVRRGAEEFARSHHQLYAPENIENAVAIEETASSASRVRDLGRKSWDKYCQLSKHLTPDAVDQDFQRVFCGALVAWLRSR